MIDVYRLLTRWWTAFALAASLAMLGAARFAAGDPLGAASAFRRLIALDPRDAQAWARLGESLVRANGDRIGADAEAAFAEALAGHGVRPWQQAIVAPMLAAAFAANPD